VVAVRALRKQWASVVVFEVQADGLGEGAFVGVTVEAGGEQVGPMSRASKA
jgi:hypothetical protein